MEIDIERRKQKLENLLCGIQKDSILDMRMQIQQQLSDFDLLSDDAISGMSNPVNTIARYLDSCEIGRDVQLPTKFNKTRSIWFAVLALYLLELAKHDDANKRRFLNFFNYAYNSAQKHGEDAELVETEIAQLEADTNSAENERLNKKKYRRNDRLKLYAYEKYRRTRALLMEAGLRPSYDMIIGKIIEDIKNHNLDPISKRAILGKNDIGRDGKPDPTKGLKRWFQDGVSDGTLDSPRKK